MNKVANSDRPHIVIVGRRNVGKSSLINNITDQELSIVSDVAGTTTDPVKKAYELLPFGPVVMVDTAGIDDEGELGEKRISKTMKAISQADLAVLVLDARERLHHKERELISHLERISVNFFVVINKIEFGVNPELLNELKELEVIHFEVSCKEKCGFDTLRTKMIRTLPEDTAPPLISDLINKNDVVVLVVPIDPGAPKNRIILPQVQALREVLDTEAIAVVAQHNELSRALDNLKAFPDLVVTDSQAIKTVAAIVPEKIRTTTFSILMARHKGDLTAFVQGLKKVNELEEGDKVLIAESCSHHVQEDDIGKVKIPNWLKEHTGKNFQLNYSYGHDFPESLSEYKLIIHCGGCMLTRRAMLMRINEAKLMNVPIANYGMIISYMNGAIPRALLPFDKAIKEWNKVKTLN